MILGKVRCGFFQELVLHRQFPRFAFKLPKPGPLTHAQRWLVTGMLTPISIDPVPQSALIDTELLGHLSDRTRCLDHQFHGLFPILGREVPLRTRQDFSFPDGPILVGSLSGKSGAHQAPLTYTDETRPHRPNPVTPATRSAPATRKASRHQDTHHQPVRSFRGLLDHLAALTRNDLRYGTDDTAPIVPTLAVPTPTQRRAFELLDQPIPLTLK